MGAFLVSSHYSSVARVKFEEPLQDDCWQGILIVVVRDF
jgi:hypothetical protein